MSKKFLISTVVLFIVSMGIGFLIHGFLLGGDYALTGLFRPDDDAARHFPFMLIAHVLMAAAFVWIYLKGREDKPFLAQGLRYGLAVALLMTVPIYLIYYAVQPMPGVVVLKQIIFDTIGVVLMGVVVAWINK